MDDNGSFQQQEAEDANQKATTSGYASGAYTFGRRLALAGLGTVFFGIEQVQSLYERAAERGQLMEEDAQRLLVAASEHSTAVMSSRLASVLNRLPGVRITYQSSSQFEQSGDAAVANPESKE